MHSVQLVFARQLECDISLRVCLSTSSRVIAIFAVVRTLRSKHHTDTRGEAKTKINALGAAFL